MSQPARPNAALVDIRKWAFEKAQERAFSKGSHSALADVLEEASKIEAHLLRPEWAVKEPAAE